MDTNKPIIFVGGKGGVGKSTTSAAIAHQTASKGRETLLVSTDPAHNLGDIFDMELRGSITRVANHLSILEIDSEIETDRYISQVKQNLNGFVKSSLVEEVHRQIDAAKVSPGAEEAALFDRIISIVLEEREVYDTIIFDTAPTGHTIRLLSLPELMGVWIEGMIKKREKTNKNYSELLNDGKPVDDPIYQVLMGRKERFSKARDLLLNPEVTGLIFVLTPERLPILETKKAVHRLENNHLNVGTLIVNKVLPEEIGEGFFKERKKLETKYLQLIDETFNNKEIVHVPLLAEDIVSNDQLELFSQSIGKEEV
ncbi:ArsA family ATPase [Aquibacillus albus]|uniref:Arsenite-transporting ATPase n=1 Tax=Aquibacillus albus TaxID=1168171 RepID=A0ABS2N2B3_9BACI|nr:ArsA family ATPase [Aquibacillus albus]MBM7572183.1 arsenite-transporting ATPase [Aquibacillus albus]